MSLFGGGELRLAFGGVARNSVNVWAGVLGSQAAAASLVFASEPRAPTLAPPASCLLPLASLALSCLRSFPRQSLHPSTQCPAARATEVM